MAFVLDPNDPSNLGMFSKAGRFTSEKYIIFQKKDEIIHNQRKFLKVTSLPHLKMDFEGKDPNKSIHDEEDERPKGAASSKNIPEFEPFSQQVSRDKFYEVKKIKHPPPPCGFYNPKFEHVEKGARTLFRYNKEKTKEKFFSTMTDFSEEEASRRLPDKLKKKVPGPNPLHLQTTRGQPATPGNDPHESRFTFLEFPGNCGRARKPLTVDMSKTLGRDYKLMFKSLEYSPDYEPNFEFGKKQLGTSGPSFEKRTKRKGMHYTSSSTNENFFNTSKSEDLKFGRTTLTLFDQHSPRHSDASSPLPSFMQKTMNSRFAIGTLRQKTLEINGFGDGKFQTNYSSFYPKSPTYS